MLRTQGEDVFPIPGTKRVKYLEVCAAGCCWAFAVRSVVWWYDAVFFCLLTWPTSAGDQENAAAFFIELSKQDKAYLEDIFAPGKVSRRMLSILFALLRFVRYSCSPFHPTLH